MALIPRALATLPIAARNTSGLVSSRAAVRYSAITSSLSRYALMSNSESLVAMITPDRAPEHCIHTDTQGQGRCCFGISGIILSGRTDLGARLNGLGLEAMSPKISRIGMQSALVVAVMSGFAL